MKHYRRTTSCWLISQALCFCLLLQGSGIAQALPLPPKKTFISEIELEATPAESAVPDSESAGDGPFKRFANQAMAAAEATSVALGHWLEDPWADATANGEAPLRVAQASGMLPLPARLTSALLASSSRGQAAPPQPSGPRIR